VTKIVLTDGSEENVSPGEARAKVAAGEATYYVTTALASAQSMSSQYKTRQMTAEPPKKKRKRRTKAEIEADEAAAAEATECPADESA
jgi:hypothetical protein